jgi:hypothetical protein
MRDGSAGFIEIVSKNFIAIRRSSMHDTAGAAFDPVK